MSDEEKFCGVEVILSRMKSHPEEFFEAGDKRGRWSFIYKYYFKDSLSESETGRIMESLRVVRHREFDAMVVKELMKEEVVMEEAESYAYPKGVTIPGGMGTVSVTGAIGSSIKRSTP